VLLFNKTGKKNWKEVSRNNPKEYKKETKEQMQQIGIKGSSFIFCDVTLIGETLLKRDCQIGSLKSKTYVCSLQEF
jgi:hypothetical protein